ncbi:uncharacterized protein CLUP02_16802 [Colletotrichum lupini]|uniref:Uncharacterized protein n=1 Tax=Colletotrichum lupini TaxID=145971 RepID=A0A9Q8WPJ2_9PEZI|nr:uncharacterized protein CLUP02_16802 [Colletotrichum lupini]UQC91268.1 hypothetical protein CLUP02_16802 [Colletotrichum lupini]
MSENERLISILAHHFFSTGEGYAKILLIHLFLPLLWIERTVAENSSSVELSQVCVYCCRDCPLRPCFQTAKLFPRRHIPTRNELRDEMRGNTGLPLKNDVLWLHGFSAPSVGEVLKTPWKTSAFCQSKAEFITLDPSYFLLAAKLGKCTSRSLNATTPYHFTNIGKKSTSQKEV